MPVSVKTRKKRVLFKPEEEKQNGSPVKNETEAVSNGTTTKAKTKKNVEIDYYDSSDEEDLRNTIGNIPVKWYRDEEHIGYDQKGTKIGKPLEKGEIDKFLEKMEDPDYWRKVFDRQSGQDVVLSEEQIQQLHAISSGKCPTIGYNPYTPFLDIYSGEPTIHPIDNIPERKSAFIPSKSESLIVSKLVHAIKMGYLKPRKPKSEKEEKPLYDLWANEDDPKDKSKSALARMRVHCPAPKLPLPQHIESYNPPEEYLFTEEEKKAWEEMDPEDRRIPFIPQKYDALRKVPQFQKFIIDQFDRCRDLYLAPRQIKMRVKVDDHKDLLPDLPNPNDLKPFPTTLAYKMTGSEGQVRSISFEPERGEILASGGEDGILRFWSVSSGRCIKSLNMGAPIFSVAYCPNSALTLIAVSVDDDNKVYLVNACVGDRLLVSETTKFIADLPIGEFDTRVDWKRTDKHHGRITLTLPSPVHRVVWHAKGDYFATVSHVDSATAVHIHQLSKSKSQCPFTKKKGVVRAVQFHTKKPHLFLATPRHIRVYDLGRCVLVKKCQVGTALVGAMCTDGVGANLFVGGLDRKFSWMDLELSTKPWKTFRHHSSAIRGVAYHSRYPLLATVSDDGTAVVYYAKVYFDAFKDNEVVPVKRLSAHKAVNGMNVLDVAWHPSRAWLFTSGADGAIAVFAY